MKKLSYAGIVLPLLAACLVGLAACPTDVEIKRPVTNIDGLTEKVAEAEALLATVKPSEDGEDIDVEDLWVPTALYQALFAAIAAGQEEVARLIAAPYEKLTAAIIDNLNTAIAAINSPPPLPGKIGADQVLIKGTIAGSVWGTVTVYSTSGDPATTIGQNVRHEDKTAIWSARVPKTYLGATVYARLSYTYKGVTTYSDETAIPIPADVPNTGIDGIVITVTGDPFGESVNIAPVATARSLDIGTNGTGIEKINDDLLGTTVTNDNYWDSGTLTPDFELDFAVPLRYNYVILRCRNMAASDTTIGDFHISAWDDVAEAWVTVYTETNGTRAVAGGSTIAANAKYGFPINTMQRSSKLRVKVDRGVINGSGPSAVSQVSLFEIEVYRVPDREDFAAKLAEAKNLLQNTNISVDGTDVLNTQKWVTEQVRNTLNTAVTVATVPFKAFDTNQAALDTAKDALATAISSFTPQDGKKTPKPTADVVSVAKTSSTQSSVVFTLTSDHGAGTWAVYEGNVGGQPIAGITAAFNSTGKTLTLANGSGSLSAREYWVSFAADTMSPSDRLGLTVAQAAGQSPQPVVNEPMKLKETTSTTVTFTLNNASAYTGGLTWAVYSTAAGAVVGNGVTITYSAGTITLNHSADVPAMDYWVAVREGTEGTSEFSEPVKLTVVRPIKLKRASISHEEPTKLVVEFVESVAEMDRSLLVVKVNEMPGTTNNQHIYTNIAGNQNPWLDITATTRNIDTAEAAAGTDNKIWNLTMNAPAKYGEIIRFATDASGGASATGAILPKVPGLIVKNGVTRTRYSFENTAGFYEVNSSGAVSQPLETGEKTMTAVRTYLQADTGANFKDGYTYVLVVSSESQNDEKDWNQTFPNYAINAGGRATVIITTPTGNSTTKTINIPYVGSPANPGKWFFSTNKSGVTLIIDKYITINDASTTDTKPATDHARKNSAQWFINTPESRIILDGGKIVSNGSCRWTLGGTYIIMNDGEISAADSQAVSPITVLQDGVFVMHGGSITNNKAKARIDGQGVDLNIVNMKGGGVGTANGHGSNGSSSIPITTTFHGSMGFYMTGGEISGNTANLNAASGAGGVLMAGEFQKTGGEIKNNTLGGTTSGVTNKAANIVVLKGDAASTDLNTGSSFTKSDASDADDTLFIDCVKPARSMAGVLSIPSWANSSWDQNNN